MNPRSRTAFTLVELLVVITIIGMLVALLLPAVNSARESARQTTCMNNQRNFGQAIQQYVTSKEYFPGYRQPVTLANGIKVVANWQVVLLPNIGRDDIYQAILAAPTAAAIQFPYMEVSVCPSDNSIAGRTTPLTSFIANTGRLDNVVVSGANVAIYVADPPTGTPVAESTVAGTVASGIFQDRVLLPNTNPISRIGLTDIKDGQGTTLMLSENVDAGYYNDGTGTGSPIIQLNSNNLLASWASDVATAHNCSERGAGFVWWDTSLASTSAAQPPTAPTYAVEGINGSHGDYDPLRLGWPSSPYSTAFTAGSQTNHAARPASNHPGGVTVVFAGGNTKFIREDIDYPVYCLLMTPNGANSPTKSHDNATPTKSWQKYYPLNDGSY